MAQDIGHVVIVGVHSDAEVERVKGPTLMTLCERYTPLTISNNVTPPPDNFYRVTVLSSCRWISEIVPCAPYTTSLSWVDHVGAQLAIHGDDIALDDDGLDSLADVKKTGRFRLVKRRKDPGAISTTKIIDRILHPNTRHHLPKANFQTFNGSFGLGAGNGQVEKPDISMLQKLELLAGGGFARHDSTTILDLFTAEKESFVKVIVSGKPPAADQRVVYLDGAFDLFTAGHASLLKAVAVKDQATYHSHEPYTMVGLYDDVTIATCKGQGFPVMNMFERAFLLLQCRVSLIQTVFRSA